MRTKLFFLSLALLGGVSSWAGTKITYDFQAAATAGETIVADGNTESLSYWSNSNAFNYIKDTESLKLFKHFAGRALDYTLSTANGRHGIYSSNGRELAIVGLSVGDKVTVTLAASWLSTSIANASGLVSLGDAEETLNQGATVADGSTLTLKSGTYMMLSAPKSSSNWTGAFAKIEIEYSDGTVDKVLPPTITSELDGLNANVTITAQKTMLGAWPTTYYTTDYTTPTTGSTSFTTGSTTVEVSDFTTVQAFSQVGENASTVVSEDIEAGVAQNYFKEEYDFTSTTETLDLETSAYAAPYSATYNAFKANNAFMNGRFALGNSSNLTLNGSALYFNTGSDNNNGFGFVVIGLKSGDKVAFYHNGKTLQATDKDTKLTGLNQWNTPASGRFYTVNKDGDLKFIGKNYLYLYKVVILTQSTKTTISTAGLATFCCNGNVDFSGIDNLKAYKASVSGSTVTLTSVTTAAKGEGVLLRNTSGGELTEKTYTIPVATTAVTKNSGNEFVGTLTNITVNQVDGDYTNFVLSKEGDVVGFFKAKTSGDGGTNVGAGKAYLPVLTSGLSEARRVSVVFDDETTAIDTIQTSKSAVDGYYDLQGRRVTQPMKGLYIVNGKKIVIK